MKRIAIYILLLVVALSGCTRLPDSYPFVNQDDAITGITLLYNPSAQNGYTGQEFEIIRELSEDEILPFMNELRSLETYLSITPPVSDFGEYIAQVSYSNGDMELFGPWHIEFVKSGAPIYGVGEYAFNDEDFEKLFLDYSGNIDYLMTE